MHVAIYSIDETEFSPLPPELENIIPLHRAPEVAACKLLWEGELSAVPSEGDALIVSGGEDKDDISAQVVMRVFHLEFDEPLLAIFVSAEPDIEVVLE